MGGAAAASEERRLHRFLRIIVTLAGQEGRNHAGLRKSAYLRRRYRRRLCLSSRQMGSSAISDFASASPTVKMTSARYYIDAAALMARYRLYASSKRHDFAISSMKTTARHARPYSSGSHRRPGRRRPIFAIVCSTGRHAHYVVPIDDRFDSSTTPIPPSYGRSILPSCHAQPIERTSVSMFRAPAASHRPLPAHTGGFQRAYFAVKPAMPVNYVPKSTITS